MRNRYWIFIILETHLLHLTNSGLMDSSKISYVTFQVCPHPVLIFSKVPRLCFVDTDPHYPSCSITTFLLSLLCHSSSVHGPVSLHRAPLDWDFPNFCQATYTSPARQASCSLAPNSAFILVFWESLYLLSSQPPGRVSHYLPGLEQSLIHSSANTSFILFTCLSPKQDTELLGNKQRYSSPPSTSSPVPGTLMKHLDT